MDKEFLPSAAQERISAAAARMGAGRTALVLGADAAGIAESLLSAGAGVFVAAPSAEALSGPAARLAPRYPGRLATLCGTPAALPLPASTVDAAFCIAEGADPWSALPELARVLRPGGTLLFGAPLGGPSGRAEALKRFAAAGLLTAADRIEFGSDWLLACGRRPLWHAAPDEKAALATGAAAHAYIRRSPSLCCAEAVICSVAEALGMDSPLVPRLATGFCAGMSLTNSHCGIFSGGVAAIGMALGRDAAREDHGLIYAAVEDFQDYFRSQFHTLDCTELTGCDLTTPEGTVEFEKRDCKTKICGKVIEAATAQVLRIIADIADEN